MATPPPVVGKNFHRQIWIALRSHDDLQLHADQPIPHLPAAVSVSLPRWLEGKRYPSRDAVRSRFRTSTGSTFSAGRSRRSIVYRVECLSEPRVALCEWRFRSEERRVGK